MPPETESGVQSQPPTKPPAVIAKWVAGVLCVLSTAGTIYGLFTDKRIAILAFIGMVFAMVLLLIVARAARAMAENKSVLFYDTLVKIFVSFVVLYFIVLSCALFPSLYRFLIQPPPVPSSEMALLSSMTQDLDKERYVDAETRADQVLKLDPNNFDALNAKGSVKFYGGEYSEAIKFFKMALAAAPDKNDTVIRKNLADSYVENGDYQQAVQEYVNLDDTGNVEWKFHLARAYLYADNYQKCLDYIKEVPTDVFGGHPRFIQAAALAGLLGSTPETGKETILREIRQNLIEGRNADPSYWDGIFSGKKDEHIGYAKVLQLVGTIYKPLQSEKQ